MNTLQKITLTIAIAGAAIAGTTHVRSAKHHIEQLQKTIDSLALDSKTPYGRTMEIMDSSCSIKLQDVNKNGLYDLISEQCQNGHTMDYHRFDDPLLPQAPTEQQRATIKQLTSEEFQKQAEGITREYHRINPY